MDFFGLGGGGLKIEIVLHTPTGPSSGGGGVAVLDHAPGWKVRKNPFASLKYPSKELQQHHSGLAADKQLLLLDDNSSITTDRTSPASPYYTTTSQQPTAPAVTYAYDANQDVEGTVHLYLTPGRKTDHLGIKVQFVGRIDMTHAVHESRPQYDFISLSKELSPPGTIYNHKTLLPFHFRNVEKQHESYRGRNVTVRYFIRVLVERKFFPPIQREQDVIIQIRGIEPIVNEAIKMEVGIEDCLHIEFEYQKRSYHLEDVILGKINFLLVRIKIKHMELAVIRRETSGEGVVTSLGAGTGTAGGGIPSNPGTGHMLTETQTLTKYEIMDGAPVKGETIPVRLYLKGIPADLTPTYNAMNNRFTVRYFLNLVLVDEEDRRYFKQQEILLWRKEIG